MEGSLLVKERKRPINVNSLMKRPLGITEWGRRERSRNYKHNNRRIKENISGDASLDTILGVGGGGSGAIKGFIREGRKSA